MADRREILFLAHRIPWPPDRGDKIRSHHLLKAMAKLAPVHVGCFADDARDAGFAAEMSEVTASQCVRPLPRGKLVAGAEALLFGRPVLTTLYRDKGLREWVDEVLARRPIAAVVAYSVQMAQYVPVRLVEGQRFVMDFVDFDSAKYAAYGVQQGGAMGWINRREGVRLLQYERQIARRADIATFVSAAEAEMFRRAASAPEHDIRVLENGVDTRHFNPLADFSAAACEHKPLTVFVGQMDYRPNIEAAAGFANASLPLIREAFPDARFAIVGRNPAPQVEALGDLPGVVVTGNVADTRGWLAAADVVVAPLHIARGVQNKVLEAMAMARPVVLSPQAAEGIDALDGTHFVIADGAREEARAVAELLGDLARAAALGKAARERVVSRYGWDRALTSLPQLLFGSAAS